MLDTPQSGYVCRAKDILPPHGSRQRWQVLIHYEMDSRVLLEDPIDAEFLQFAAR